MILSLSYQVHISYILCVVCKVDVFDDWKRYRGVIHFSLLKSSSTIMPTGRTYVTRLQVIRYVSLPKNSYKF